MKAILGCILIISPVVLIIAAQIHAYGIKDTLLGIGFIIILVSMVLGGISLLDKDKE